jgi:hypothetical protein
MNADGADGRGSDSTIAASSRRRLLLLLALLAIAGAGLAYVQNYRRSLPVIGATATVTELTSGALLRARVDTGAILCSIHCEEVDPPAGDEDGPQEVGDAIRFRIVDSARKSHWVEAELAEVTTIRTTSEETKRLCVYLPLRVSGVEATVLVTLNHRGAMNYPFLIGRNLLRERFVVDVNLHSDDAPGSGESE